jgi:hypothetical protein
MDEPSCVADIDGRCKELLRWVMEARGWGSAVGRVVVVVIVLGKLVGDGRSCGAGVLEGVDERDGSDRRRKCGDLRRELG